MGRFGNPEEWAGRICDNPEPIFLELLRVSRGKKPDYKWIDEPIEKEMRIEFVPASVFQSQRVLLMLHRSSLCCK